MTNYFNYDPYPPYALRHATHRLLCATSSTLCSPLPLPPPSLSLLASPLPSFPSPLSVSLSLSPSPPPSPPYSLSRPLSHYTLPLFASHPPSLPSLPYPLPHLPQTSSTPGGTSSTPGRSFHPSRHGVHARQSYVTCMTPSINGARSSQPPARSQTRNDCAMRVSGRTRHGQ